MKAALARAGTPLPTLRSDGKSAGSTSASPNGARPPASGEEGIQPAADQVGGKTKAAQGYGWDAWCTWKEEAAVAEAGEQEPEGKESATQ
jgi:hypothetical protein